MADALLAILLIEAMLTVDPTAPASRATSPRVLARLVDGHCLTDLTYAAVREGRQHDAVPQPEIIYARIGDRLAALERV
ncbi:MAG: hypothetical protein M3Z02_02620 [Actinomycetota bacterium]|nr:hypothetical protein [Actinomycetota bacterium]